MNRPLIRILSLSACIGLLIGCRTSTIDAEPIMLKSPDGANGVTFLLRDGVPYYQVRHGDAAVIKPSRLGIRLRNEADLTANFAIEKVKRLTFDETWTQPWGETAHIRNHYNELWVSLRQLDSLGRRLNLYFRAYDDGVAFRYELPKQEGLPRVEIMDEATEFALAGDHSAWWIPAYRPERYEYLYSNTPLSRLDTVHTPLTMETVDGLFLSIHEAALTDYAGMALANKGANTLECDLAPWSDGVKVRGGTPLVSPWRTIQIAEIPGELITSYLVLNLNEPNALDDVSWIEPGKYVGIWWGMHIGKYTWESGEKHGATTANTHRYIDFAAENGFDGVLVEGWNTGWDGDWIANGDLFSFTESYPDYDLEGLATYAAGKDVRLIGHNETSTGIRNYERQLEDAFALYHRMGINTVKSGYVGHGRNIRRLDPATGELLGLEWHHGQYMVRHYRKVVEVAARHQIMLDVHEPIKATGIRRTWPNMMTREGARGQEWNAWGHDGGNTPEYTTILPFTRLLAGPFDFTPGIFDLYFEEAGRPDNRISTTLAKQLALYVVLYSPLHMAADLPENYEGQPAFQFIRDVPTDWEETRVPGAVIGEYVTIVRKDRHGPNWYLGSITNDQGRTLTVNLDFLDEGIEYVAEIYADAGDSDWRTNPLAMEISRLPVNRATRLELRLAPGGGQAIRFRPVAVD